jgi:cytochrome P450
MALFPLMQARGQAEVDKYLSHMPDTRLPQISDRPFMPYVEALMLEILRWNPSVPLGLPHVAKKDDVYRGYHIRKGTVVWANIWSVPVLCPRDYLVTAAQVHSLRRSSVPGARPVQA